MKKKVLVLGGTRYFGRHLVSALKAKNYEVLVVTRTSETKADRKNPDDLKRLAQMGPFDLIFDQICMSGMEAQIAVEAFRDVCGKYIFTSTGSVYDFKNDHVLVESDFDPLIYPIKLMATTDYKENKRQAEAVFSAQKHFPVSMVRFPIVLGTDDYTQRLKFHVDKILKGEEIYMERLETKLAFIESHEAGEFLSFIGESDHTGPVNAASNGVITLQEIVHQIEEATGKKAILAKRATPTNGSPFGSNEDFVLGNDLAKSLGFQFKNLDEYLPGLINHFSKD
ncbi:MAG: NAD-dependent epimerase/dehydratase family protein [Bacteriovorax sp.]